MQLTALGAPVETRRVRGLTRIESIQDMHDTSRKCMSTVGALLAYTYHVAVQMTLFNELLNSDDRQ